ncbi:nuclease [Actinomadura craniellae]|uniref:Nuclease n=1 Tax=Actinomadura craniellae TaxID=2231787 RepID=A0A365GY87_9ACTN|nr:ExeM/NucH family extracellular endonuclease [Actinomadura craniellae]RAY11800.1 nuclease [Actinomadura craniellae]
MSPSRPFRRIRQGAGALAVTLTAGLLVALGATGAQAEPGTVVISQVYGGGGNSGAPLTHDYVELFNRGSAPVDVTGWSVQYASATGTGHFAAARTTLQGTITPGGYHLVQMGAGAGSGTALPAPDGTGSTAMSATGGKVALVRSDQGLACNGGATPCDDAQRALISDLVGYGSADFFEGAAAPALSNTTAGLRNGNGCADTDHNATDFTAGAPAPRNTATTAAPCAGGPEPTPTPTPTPTGNPCDTPATHEIAQVQGTGEGTPLAGQTVRVEGIVTGDFQGTDQLGGFFVQDPTPDADPATSDGLFVFSRTEVRSGDRVLVTGRAIEFNGLTELSPVTAVDVCGTGTIAPAAQQLPRTGSPEPQEGMLLTFPQRLTASEHYQLGRYGEVTVSAGGRLFQPTDGRHGVTQAGNDLRRLLIDDGSTRENPAQIPYLDPAALRLGDTVTGLTGVLSYGFGSYRLQPTEPVAFTRSNPRPAAPAKVGGDVKVASFNTLNWFTTLGSRGAGTEQERERQLAKLAAAIKGLNADVIGLMEVENNGDVAVRALVDRLNAEAGAGTYAWVRNPNPGTDEIHVALIYRPGKVRPVGPARSSDEPVFERPPLAQTFMRTRGSLPFTVLVNHFKSKSCGDATGPDADQGDGQGCWNARRVLQAKALAALARRVPAPLVIGDLNAYAAEDPIKTLAAAGLTSQTERFVPADRRYSYVFNGQAGELDHALAGWTLAWRVTGTTIWHINSDEPLILDYNTEYNPPGLYRPDAYRSSDHDPVLIGLRLPGLG